MQTIDEILPLEKRNKHEKFICVICLICEKNAEKLGLKRDDDKIHLTQNQIFELIQKHFLETNHTQTIKLFKELGALKYFSFVNDFYKPSQSAWAFYDLYKKYVKNWDLISQEIQKKEGC